jgi:hypothetical protein
MFSIFKDYCPFTTYNPLLTAILQIGLLCFFDILINAPVPHKPVIQKTSQSSIHLIPLTREVFRGSFQRT